MPSLALCELTSARSPWSCGVTFKDCTGLSALVRLDAECGQRRVVFKIHDVPDCVRQAARPECPGGARWIARNLALVKWIRRCFTVRHPFRA